MALTTILAAAMTDATSTSVIVAAGGVATIGAFVATGQLPVGPYLRVHIATPGATTEFFQLSRATPITVLSGPGTYTVIRDNIAGYGVNVGVFADT